MGDAVVAIPLILILILPFALLRMWRWVGLIGILAGYEGILAIFGKTLSQEWWAVGREHSMAALIIILIVSWAILLVHLQWKKIKGGLDQWRKQ